MLVFIDIDGTLRDLHLTTYNFAKSMSGCTVVPYDEWDYTGDKFIVRGQPYKYVPFILDFCPEALHNAPKTREFDDVMLFANSIPSVDIRIVTAFPVIHYEHPDVSQALLWIDSTYRWIKENMGDFWLTRMLPMSSELRVKIPDILIDDYPYEISNGYKAKIYTVPRSWNTEQQKAFQLIPVRKHERKAGKRGMRIQNR